MPYTESESRFDYLEIDDAPIAAAKPTSAPAATVPERTRCIRCGVASPLTEVGTCAPCEHAQRPRETTSSSTPMNVPMSPGMQMLYKFFAARNIRLTSFSTDQDVVSMLPRLEMAIVALTERPDSYGMTATQAAEICKDVRNIMRRVPASRAVQGAIGGAAVTPAPEATLASIVAEQSVPVAQAVSPAVTSTPAPIERVSAKNLVGVADEASSTGTMTYWSLCGSVTVAALRAAWEAEGLDTTKLPEVPSATVALHRACKALSSKRRLLRAHSEGGWVLTDLADKIESAEAEQLDAVLERLGTRVRLSEAAPGQEETILVTPPKGAGTEASAEAVAQARVLGESVRASFNALRGEVAATDVSGWLVGLIGGLNGISLRDSGGFYFVPRECTGMLAKIVRALEVASAHKVYEIPVMQGTKTVAAVLDSFQREIAETVERVEGELASSEGMGARAATNRIEELGELAKKISGYEVLLGVKLGSTVAKLDALRVKLGAVTTRFSSLDVSGK